SEPTHRPRRRSGSRRRRGARARIDEEDGLPELDLRFRHADPLDGEPIARLHADSWRRHYRGAYSDSFLDGDVATDRLTVWSGRLRDPGADSCTIVAESDGALVGFAHTVLDEDRTWGALLDNLHVAHAHQRRGVGARLVALTAAVVAERRPGSGLFLWVL